MSMDRRYFFERLMENFYALDETFQEQNLPSLFDDVDVENVEIENPDDFHLYETLKQLVHIVRLEVD